MKLDLQEAQVRMESTLRDKDKLERQLRVKAELAERESGAYAAKANEEAMAKKNK